eukprot:1159568-Pelagomonas_calceolata.AAC.6
MHPAAAAAAAIKAALHIGMNSSEQLHCQRMHTGMHPAAQKQQMRLKHPASTCACTCCKHTYQQWCHQGGCKAVCVFACVHPPEGSRRCHALNRLYRLAPSEANNMTHWPYLDRTIRALHGGLGMKLMDPLPPVASIHTMKHAS